VHWELLAAVMLIETRMGRIVSNSSAGAQGPMQFIPSTWAAYGLGGDVRDDHDAVLGAANYLSANGAPSDDRNALFHYNPVPAYVTAVTRYAKAMERDPDLFYAYYNWQVFVRTTRGDVRPDRPGSVEGRPPEIRSADGPHAGGRRVARGARALRRVVRVRGDRGRDARIPIHAGAAVRARRPVPMAVRARGFDRVHGNALARSGWWPWCSPRWRSSWSCSNVGAGRSRRGR
jgi:hypothetical protein